MKIIQEKVVELEELKKKLELVLKNTCKDIIITGFYIEKPSLMNKSSFRTCIIFSSLDDHISYDMINLFKSVNDSDSIITISNSINLLYSRFDTNEYTLILFQKIISSVHPLC